MNHPAGRVLVVDDNESTRFVFGSWLRRAGFTVQEASTGAEGIEAFGSGLFDLVILDVNLPDMLGFDVSARIKADPATSAVPVLHVSATAIETTDKSAGLRRGADAYLVEPLEREELLATVDALLRYSRARRQAETLARRLGWLHTTTLELNAATDAESLVRIAVTAAANLHGSHAVAAVPTDGGGVVGAASPSLPAMHAALSREDLQMLPKTPEAVIARVLPGYSPTGTALRVLLATGRTDRVAGMVIIEQWGDEADGLGPLIEQLAQAMVVAADNLRLLAREHAIAVTLQHSLLPTIPAIEWLDVAVRYVASTAQVEVGGDFYEVLPLDEYRVALAIGDVQGHSLRAAIVMSTLRNSLNAYLLEGRSPGDALDLLNRVFMQLNPEMIATVCCLILHRDGTAVIANAGHLPPVVISEGRAKALPTGGPLLGVEREPAETTLVLSAGSAIVLFTDGLVERRDKAIDIGLANVLDAIDATGPNVEAICDRLLTEVGPGPATRDDVAVLAVRLRPPVAPLD